MSEANQRLAQRAYYASVSHMDEQLGRLLEFVRKTELLDDTLVLLTSDHGYHLGWRGQWAKHELYHLPTDSYEYYNVFDKPKNARIVEQLQRLLATEFGELTT